MTNMDLDNNLMDNQDGTNRGKTKLPYLRKTPWNIPVPASSLKEPLPPNVAADPAAPQADRADGAL